MWQIVLIGPALAEPLLLVTADPAGCADALSVGRIDVPMVRLDRGGPDMPATPAGYAACVVHHLINPSARRRPDRGGATMGATIPADEESRREYDHGQANA
jgi:hypothetical protein